MDSQELTDILSKEFDDIDLVQKITGSIFKNSYIGFIMSNLREGLFDFVSSVIKVTINIEIFRSLLVENINKLVYTSLFSEESGKIALDLHKNLIKTDTCEDSSIALLTLVYHHGLLYPKNMSVCLDYIKKHPCDYLVMDRCFYYIRDEVSIVKRYINNKETDRNKILKYASEHDCINIVKKLMMRQRVNHLSTIKMSIDVFIEFLNSQRIYISTLKNIIFFECFNHNRWDMLPFIMMNYKLDDHDWSYIKLFFESGKLTLPFVQTFFHLIYTYKISLCNAMIQNSIVCTQDVANFLSYKGYGLLYKFHIIANDDQKLDLEYNICTLFHHYLSRSYTEIVNIIYYRNGYRCKRLENERNLFRKLYSTNLIKWNDDLITEYQNFEMYLDNIFEQFIIMEKIVLEFNSLAALINYDDKNTMMIFRCLNSLITQLGQINLVYLQNEYKNIYDTVGSYYFQIYPKVCEQIGIDPKWEMPLNPSSLDILIHLNLTSCIGNKKMDLTKINELMATIHDSDLIQYIETSIGNFVNVDDIINTLTP
jgi:hypothetical protein